MKELSRSAFQSKIKNPQSKIANSVRSALHPTYSFDYHPIRMTQPQSTPTGATNPAATPAIKKPDNQGSVKETLESILVAFILAFIFRAFVVEAFVIPTGSMAPTLLGAHMRFRCNDCGYQFTINYNGQQSNGDLIIKDTADVNYKVICPNCGYRFPSVPDIKDPANSTSNHPVHYGDRILVLKSLYLLNEPQRWDVVVFKSPDTDPGDADPTYTQNYIKRLVGKPGESIMVLDGDVYVGKAGEPRENYVIQTKPRYAQQALWRVIYDNDFHPVGVERPDGTNFQQPWTARSGDGWNLGSNAFEARKFHFNNASGASTLYFDKNAKPNEYAFTDWIAYDADQPTQMNVVHDLKLAFDYERQSGSGPLRVMLSDGERRFAAVVKADQASLVEETSAGDQPIGAPARIKAGSDPVHVELTTVDYQVTLRIDGKPIAQTTPEQFHPDIDRLLEDFHSNRHHAFPSAEITAGAQSCTLSHIGLWRDVYYLNHTGYTHLTATPDNPTDLGADEYFVMGDNSLVSKDARYWDHDIHLPADHLEVKSGRVPGRGFLLGRAFFVYWPAGFAPAPGLPHPSRSNFGDMRNSHPLTPQKAR